ncbi:MAG: putative lipid II flippase FtsW [Clostridia bacterium]|nr:putative lipid II flippase FtsW [Clostridia bacterium]
MGKRIRLNIPKGNGNVDFTILILVLALTLFGITMVFSASYYWALDDPTEGPYFYLIRQGAWALIGFIFMIVFSQIPYEIYGKDQVVGIVLLASLGSLVLLFTPLGVNINGATRWLNLGVTTVMPGEFAKLAVIIVVSAFLAKEPKRILSFKRGILPLIVLAGIYALLIYKQPNLSTALVVVGIILAIAILAGLRFRYVFLAVGGLGLLVISLLVFKPNNYQVRRMMSFVDPFKDALGDGFQAVQSLLALGSGGLFGVGIGKSVQKNLYIPEPQNDFILSIIGEELGFVGIIILLAVYTYLIYRGFKVALNAKDRLGMFLAGGVTSMLAIQVIINVAVVTSSMPCTGITLPFISYGGNAMLMFMMSMGILLNVSKKSRR